MVPSWTETLIEAGADVVGRSRFCIHPMDRVKGIPAIGGTKDWDTQKLASLAPDRIILDREENTLQMAEVAGRPMLATHVRSVRDLPAELRRLGEALMLPGLMATAGRYEAVLTRGPIDLGMLPGVTDWIRRPSGKIEKVLYMIWKNPWMTVSP